MRGLGHISPKCRLSCISHLPQSFQLHSWSVASGFKSEFFNISSQSLPSSGIVSTTRSAYAESVGEEESERHRARAQSAFHYISGGGRRRASQGCLLDYLPGKKCGQSTTIVSPSSSNRCFTMKTGRPQVGKSVVSGPKSPCSDMSARDQYLMLTR